ncbi:Malate dehydrogenase, cytoplasmic [Armadillidium nasatum]|uniref:Malate dehydrogenase n=1 Tax=Armadillidium nasatum TaxID=96803 RepID=A0A5N5T7V8_9CRUS|nr:Malate dehydrogenase, cytoplasmic [Armadillidium nasatum]
MKIFFRYLVRYVEGVHNGRIFKPFLKKKDHMEKQKLFTFTSNQSLSLTRLSDSMHKNLFVICIDFALNAITTHGKTKKAEPVKVCITGAAGQIGYSLVYMVGSGAVFGTNTPVVLHLLDIAPMMGVLNGVCMEISDCALPCVRELYLLMTQQLPSKILMQLFLLGQCPAKKGQALDQHAKKSVKVLVVGNPANTNALICSKYAPSIPKENFSAMTRLDHNRAQAQISQRLGIPVADVKNIIIWGNHSSTQFPDVSHAIATVEGKDVPVYDAVKDSDWLKGDFITTVQKRGAAVIQARKLSSAMSAAKAASDHMHDWWHSTPEGKFVSMGVFSDGSYNTPEGVMFSFPVTLKNKQWTIVQGLPIDQFAQGKLDITGKELCEERDEALAVCKE